MWNRRSNDYQTPVVPGVVETIGLAYSRLIAQPWIVLGPILLDLYLWLGLRVTAGPLVLKTAESIRPLRAVGETSARFLERQQDYNLAQLLSLQLPSIRVPTLLPALSNESPIYLASWKPELMNAPWWALAALLPLALAGGFVGGSAFLLWLADVARGVEHHFSGRLAVDTGARLFFWVLAAAGMLVLLSWPLIVVQAALILTGIGGSEFLALLMTIPAGIGFVLFFFSAHAIVMDRVSAIQAFRSSYRVVRAYGWQSFGFMASYLVVIGGFPFVWRLLISEPPGALIAIVGNAFVSSGMIAAGMIYYQDRAAVVGAGGAAA